jgi:hypothetical protein
MNDSRDINSTTTTKNVKKTITIIATAIIVTIVSFSITSSSISPVTMVLAQQADNTTTTTTTTTTTSTTTITLTENVVQVNATEINEVYRWQINGQINPDLRLLANTAYTFTLQNPTDTKHELIIADSQGKELATSGEIQPGSSGILNFKTNTTSSGDGNMLGYHCEYHPDLMKGAIQTVNQ